MVIIILIIGECDNEREKNWPLFFEVIVKSIGGYFSQDDHSADTLKFPDNSLTIRGTHAHVKWYSL